ncbi:MAG: DUF1569 domain-containing protein [Vicinamibacterales bacterium]
MINLFEIGRADAFKKRVAQISADTAPQWGTMNAAQAMAHCAIALEAALGDTVPPRMLIGRLIGPLVARTVLSNDKPLQRNAPTARQYVVSDPRDLAAERDRLCTLIDRFAQAGPRGCTTKPHTFFGRLTPERWAILMDKHLDHHLRQFGV